MGTRNLTKVIDKDGVIRVAQYGQWDGYPSGQGINALTHARNSQSQIEKGLSRCRWITEDEAEAIYATMPEMNYVGTEDSNKFSIMYPNLTRDTGADILAVVAYSIGEVLLVDNTDFENDDLFCEGVYTIDFNTNKFISRFGIHDVEFPLDSLPTPEEYLAAFQSESVVA